MSTNKLVSICIPCHNQEHFLSAAINSCLTQDYENIEIIVLDDASATPIRKDEKKNIKYLRSETPSGTGGSFNKCMKEALGEYVILLCSDDVFSANTVVSRVVEIFEKYPAVGHVSRYYYQFEDGHYEHPVRAWRTNDIIEQANNPSGLAFRRSAIGSCELSNKMFVEASYFVNCILKKKWSYHIIEWDTVAVRIHQSISRSKEYYLKRWVSSPVEEWVKVNGKSILKDHTSLIQIKNYFTVSSVLKECWNFIRLRPFNIISPSFWFFALLSVFCPRYLLRVIPSFYRKTIGRWTTKKIYE